MRIAGVIAWSKALAALAITAMLFPLQFAVRQVSGGPGSFAIPRLWHRALCRVLAIEAEQVGDIDVRAGTIYVGNHLSHFDVFVVGACVRAAFIAKGEMAGWPGMKFLGAMQQTLFVSRRARDAAKVAAHVREVLGRGTRLVLFAEGTTSPGVTVAPFRSSLFEILADPSPPRVEARLQPFTLELIQTDGRRIDRGGGGDRDLYAFHGGAPAGAHVWRFLRSRGARLRITFHAPLDATQDMTRKDLALAAHAAVSNALGQSPRGSLQVVGPSKSSKPEANMRAGSAGGGVPLTRTSSR